MEIPRQNINQRQGSIPAGDPQHSSYLDPRQVAAWLGICKRTLVNLRHRQVVPFVKVGRMVRYQRDAVELALKAYWIGSHFQAGDTPPVGEYTHIMRRRSKTWPRLYTRKYPTGAVKYGVDLGRQGGKKRDRPLFDTKGERDAFVRQARAACEEQGQLPFFLPRDAQSQAVMLYEFLKEHNIRFEDVQRHYAEDVIPYIVAPNVPEIATHLLAKVERKYLHRRRTSWPDKLRGFLNEFGRAFGGKITEIREDELEAFCFRGDAAVTERDRRSMAAQLFNHAIKRGWAKINLAKNLDIPVLPIKEPEYLTVVEARRLLSAANEFGLLGYFVLGFFLGIRPEEMHCDGKKKDGKKKKPTMLWSDVHVDDRMVVVRAEVSKIGVRRDLPIDETLAAWLPLCIRDGGPIVDPTNFQERFKACRAAAGLLDSWIQDGVRHTFATNHAAAYKDLNETARLMGHIGGLRILKKHYVGYVSEKAALEFWALRPSDLKIVQPALEAVTELPPKAA